MTADSITFQAARANTRAATNERTAPGKALRVRVSYPNSESIVVAAFGEIDAATVARYEEALLPRLSAAVRLVVVDLKQVHFLGVPGLELLHRARLLAEAQGVVLRLVADTGEVLRALDVAGLASQLDCFSTALPALATGV
ncbi:STAS domain-containing protein [Saccharopolyspora phatthalungensis]|uniref:Anti-anti-sigma factor n=1 Tax=Saccharopolyspora phatthalungensis TaxID=664693 RepID=A0A840QF22_9PSEU|nr:STAS domain-containing protein [Saccharopolyspora phatthalungensis]MBB5158647.1 anti-anti-sigma factor [Saccharopolyspora phatthalungensis]